MDPCFRMKENLNRITTAKPIHFEIYHYHAPCLKCKGLREMVFKALLVGVPVWESRLGIENQNEIAEQTQVVLNNTDWLV